jgi:hypothetical protein
MKVLIAYVTQTGEYREGRQDDLGGAEGSGAARTDLGRRRQHPGASYNDGPVLMRSLCSHDELVEPSKRTLQEVSYGERRLLQ